MAKRKNLPILQENGCAKICCAGFETDFSPTELGKRIECDVHLIGGCAGFVALPDDFVEWHKLHDLLEFQYETETGYHYTCRAWDAESGNCQIYEDRPEMCRDFPGPNGCSFDGCGIGPAKNRAST